MVKMNRTCAMVSIIANRALLAFSVCFTTDCLLYCLVTGSKINNITMILDYNTVHNKYILQIRLAGFSTIGRFWFMVYR